MKQRILIASLMTTLAYFARVMPIWALEITVEGNGDSASSTVDLAQTQQQTIAQTNETTVDNHVATEANTGSNTVDNSNGSAKITTGEVAQATEINNNLNVNQTVNNGCCGGSTGQTTIGIMDNGEGSTNAVSVSTTKNSNIEMTNNANISNQLHDKAETGNNTVKSNLGQATITTGEISAGTHLFNVFNRNDYNRCCSENDDLRVQINDNGHDSINSVSIVDTQTDWVKTANSSFLSDDLWMDLMTGDNYLDGTGDNFIKTGDIVLNVQISNQANENIATFACCETNPSTPPTDEKPNPPPPPPPTTITDPPKTTTSNSDPGTTLASNESWVGGQVLGAILPATGSRDFMWMFMANLLTFLFGCYLRLYSGRAPDKIK